MDVMNEWCGCRRRRTLRQQVVWGSSIKYKINCNVSCVCTNVCTCKSKSKIFQHNKKFSHFSLLSLSHISLLSLSPLSPLSSLSPLSLIALFHRKLVFSQNFHLIGLAAFCLYHFPLPLPLHLFFFHFDDSCSCYSFPCLLSHWQNKRCHAHHPQQFDTAPNQE